MNPRLGQRAPLLWLLLPFAAGLALGDWVELPCLAAAAGALAAVLLAGALAWGSDGAGSRRVWAAGLCLAGVLAGAAYGRWRLDRPAEWEGLPPREARLNLRVTQVFAAVPGRPRISGLGWIASGGPPGLRLAGQRVYFSLEAPAGAGRPLRSSEWAGSGVLELVPRHPPGRTFAGYLASAGVNFKFTRGRLLREATPPTAYRRWCAAAEQRFHQILGAGLGDHPALAAIFRAMLLGQKQEMNEEQQARFLHSGTMHLFAISGLNVTVIALSAQILLALVRVPRLASAVVSLAALWVYVDITGSSPSAVRSFVMSAFLLGAVALRRPGGVLAGVVNSALIVLLVDPRELFSASFQMSYGIVTVLILLGVPLAETLAGRWPLFADLPEPSWRWYHRRIAGGWRELLEMTGVGLASTLVSTISSIQYFQLLTPGALALNLVLIPLSTLVIGAGFLSLLCGLAGAGAGSVLFNHAGALLVGLMDGLLRLALGLPGIYQVARFRSPWIGPALQATLLAACLAGTAWRWRRDRGGFWPPFLLVTLGLLAGVQLGP